MFKLFASAITLSLFTLLSACGGGSDTTAGNGVAAYAGHYVGTVTGVTSAAHRHNNCQKSALDFVGHSGCQWCFEYGLIQRQFSWP